MENTFYTESREVREKLREKIRQKIDDIPNQKLKDILQQRNISSSFLKGVLGYLVHEGVGGNFSENKKLELASNLEVFCSAGALLDNVIDNHAVRNGKTTFLKEYGMNMQLAASQYALHYGLRLLLPFLNEYSKSQKYRVDEAVIGMIGMDIDRPITLEKHISIIEKSNGIFAETPLTMAAITGTTNPNKVNLVSSFGFNLGSGLAVYEELRDLIGEHGRRRATEVEQGRCITPLYYTEELNSCFVIGDYLGKELSRRDYNLMMKSITLSGGISKTSDLVQSYLQMADSDLSKAVSNKCYQAIKPLLRDILKNIDQINCKTNKMYGKQ